MALKYNIVILLEIPENLLHYLHDVICDLRRKKVIILIAIEQVSI